MKTVMKKLLSVMLVALLLVSAVPFQASAAEGCSVQVKVFDYPDTFLEGWTESYTVTEDEASQSTGFFGADMAEEILAGTKYDDATKYTPKSAIANFSNGVLTYSVYITVLDSSSGSGEGTGSGDGTGSGEGSGSTTNPGTDVDGEGQPEVIVTTCSLNIDYKLSSYEPNTVTASIGKLYKEYVGVPARNGYDFVGWYSSSYGRIIDVTKDILMGDDNITAIWSEAKQYTLTLDENRSEEEIVTSGKLVTYGQAIGTLPTPEREGYVFAGWKLNGTIITAETIWSIPGDGTAYAQWKLESDTEGEAMGGNTATADGKVYLEIYVNGDTSAAEKKVDITSYAKDNKITRSEVETVVKKYVTAKAGYSLAYEGLFDEESWWWYTRDPETDGKDSIIVNKDGDDYIYVMVKNVKTVEADPSNPKTGDGIVMALAAMMSTGGAALVLGKKKFF